MPYYKDPQRIATVAEALHNQNVDQLKSLLPLLPTPERPTRKAELVDLVLRCLEGENLRTIWNKLDQLQQSAIAEVVHSSESQFDRTRFQAKYNSLPNFGFSGSYGRNNNPSLLRVFFYSYDIMPDDLKKRLKAFVSQPAQAKIKSVDEIPAVIQQQWEEFNWETRKQESGIEDTPLEQRQMERTAHNDLIAVLRLINAGKVSVSDKTRYPTAATQKEIASLLSGGDYYTDPPPEERKPYEQLIGSIRAYAWPLIVQVAGLAELTGKRLSLTKAGQKALSSPSEKTLKTAWNKWLKNTLLDELRRIEVIKGQTGKGQRGLTAVAGRRNAIASALAECPVSRWVAVNEFFRYIRAAGHDFEVTRALWNLYISEAGYGNLDQGGNDWGILQGRYILCLLFEYAATLGIIDVAYIDPRGARADYGNFWGADDLDFFSRYDGLAYFRLTPLGAYCLGITDTYTPAPIEVRPVLRVLPNLEIAAIGEPLTPADVLMIEFVAQKVSDAVWRLDRAGLLEAITEGHSVSDLQEFLQARSCEPLPETVNQFLADAKERTDSLQDQGTARLIACADPALAVLIANDSRTKGYCLLAGDRSLVVPTESEAKFRNALRQLGYSLPK